MKANYFLSKKKKNKKKKKAHKLVARLPLSRMGILYNFSVQKVEDTRNCKALMREGSLPGQKGAPQAPLTSPAYLGSPLPLSLHICTMLKG
jgi:hypothetical protein